MTAESDRPCTGREYLATLSAEVTGRNGIPRLLAESARDITARRLSDLVAAPVDRAERARLRAYFWGVVRRRSIASRGRTLKPLRDRYLRASIVEDLMAADCSESRVAEELGAILGEVSAAAAM